MVVGGVNDTRSVASSRLSLAGVPCGRECIECNAKDQYLQSKHIKVRAPELASFVSRPLALSYSQYRFVTGLVFCHSILLSFSSTYEHVVGCNKLL